MRFPGRRRFGDLIARQIVLFEEEQRSLLARMEFARRAYDRAEADGAEELFGAYIDLVEEAEEVLLAFRDTYARSMAPNERERYRREFDRAAEKHLPSLVARRVYRRAIDPDTQP